MSVYPSNQQISNKKERKDKKRNRVALAPEAVPRKLSGFGGGIFIARRQPIRVNLRARVFRPVRTTDRSLAVYCLE